MPPIMMAVARTLPMKMDGITGQALFTALVRDWGWGIEDACDLISTMSSEGIACPN